MHVCLSICVCLCLFVCLCLCLCLCLSFMLSLLLEYHCNLPVSLSIFLYLSMYLFLVFHSLLLLCISCFLHFTRLIPLHLSPLPFPPFLPCPHLFFTALVPYNLISLFPSSYSTNFSPPVFLFAFPSALSNIIVFLLLVVLSSLYYLLSSLNTLLKFSFY